ncbi:DoxX family protein [Streptomyces durmitorensis]|uniref:DoxX family protein n=1 Tax=Streptomyces durmitorensis TaxID=319947 RepID=A0ABY4Q1X1_9ACTN|nr:DoxX family protein [Streptomyces durmitorensis]UQT59187.1 DoxX family protein [Streptomyces durmitorensis]
MTTATTAPSTSVPSTSARTATTGSSAPAGRRSVRITLRTIQVVLALFFALASGAPKLIAHPTAVEAFERLGWGDPGMYAIGALEVLGGIALLVPVLSSVGATGLVGLMVGAFIVSVTALGGENAATPLILILPLAWIAWARRGQNAELVRLLQRRGAGRRGVGRGE